MSIERNRGPEAISLTDPFGTDRWGEMSDLAVEVYFSTVAEDIGSYAE